MAEFNIFREMVLTQLYYRLLKYSKDCNIICDIIQNPELEGVWILFIKDFWFVFYINNSIQELVQTKIKNVTLSYQFKLPVKDIYS